MTGPSVTPPNEQLYYSTADIAQWWFYGESSSGPQVSGEASAGGLAPGGAFAPHAMPGTPTPEMLLVVHGEMFVLEERAAHPAPLVPLAPDAGLFRIVGAGAHENP